MRSVPIVCDSPSLKISLGTFEIFLIPEGDVDKLAIRGRLLELKSEGVGEAARVRRSAGASRHTPRDPLLDLDDYQQRHSDTNDQQAVGKRHRPAGEDAMHHRRISEQ